MASNPKVLPDLSAVGPVRSAHHVSSRHMLDLSSTDGLGPIESTHHASRICEEDILVAWPRCQRHLMLEIRLRRLGNVQDATVCVGRYVEARTRCIVTPQHVSFQIFKDLNSSYVAELIPRSGCPSAVALRPPLSPSIPVAELLLLLAPKASSRSILIGKTVSVSAAIRLA
jgi:hypothetical protein